MEEEIKQTKKCSSKEHLNNDAISYCPECRIYICNKCESIHPNLLIEHKTYKLENDINEIFTGFCKNAKHTLFRLEYFCKTHNELCCAACLCKLDKEGDGQQKIVMPVILKI